MIYLLTILYIISIVYTFKSMIATAEASLFKESFQQMFVMLVSSFLYAYILYLL